MKKTMKLIRLFSVLCLVIAITLSSVGCKRVIQQDPTWSEYIAYIPIDSEDLSSDNNLSLEEGNSGQVSSGEANQDVGNYGGNNGGGSNTAIGNGDVGSLENGVMVYTVEEFGAVGDGKTDDGVAINDAIYEARRYLNENVGKKAIVRFAKEKNYLCKEQNAQGATSGAVINIADTENLTIEGNGATIIGQPSKAYMTITGNSNLKIKGLNFTYDYPVACTAKATWRETNSKITFEVPEWYVEAIEKFSGDNPSIYFAIPANDRRDNAYIQTIEKLDATHCVVTFKNYGANGWSIIRTEDELKMSTDVRYTNYVYLPTPGYSHIGTAFGIRSNSGMVELENCNIWNSAQFTFQINSNSGNIVFTNVKLTPKDANSSATVSWRDTVHAKDNRGSLTFNDCEFSGTHDDIFNISSTMCRVDKVDGNKLKLYGLDYNGDFVPIKVGDTIVAFNPTTDKYYGEAKVTEVTNRTQITLDKNIGIEIGAYLSFKELAAPGTTINGGNFNGSFRIRASGTKITNANFSVVAMWTAYEGNIEGPIPENITYKNCSFKSAAASKIGGTLMTFNCVLRNGSSAMSYGVKNIVFEGCNFETDSIIQRKDGVIIR